MGEKDNSPKSVHAVHSYPYAFRGGGVQTWSEKSNKAESLLFHLFIFLANWKNIFEVAQEYFILESESRNVKQGEKPIWKHFCIAKIPCKTFPK